MLDGAADAADLMRVFLDDGDAIARLGQQVGGGEAGRAGADDRDIDGLVRT